MARRKVWVPYRVGVDAAASTNSLTDLLGNLPGDLEAIGGLTVSRIIGQVSFRPGGLAFQEFSLFIAVVHEDQSQTNMAMDTESFPGVMWSWLGRTNGAFIETAASSFSAVEERAYYDIKVQRKIPAQHQLVAVTMNGAGESLDVQHGGRALISLP